MPSRFGESLRDTCAVLGMFILVLIITSVVAWLFNAMLALPIWISSLAAQLMFFCASLVLTWALRKGWRWLGLFPSTRGLAKASLASISVATVIVSIISLMPTEGQGQPELVEDPLLLAILTLLIAPLCEETFFRGLLQGYMMDREHRKLSIIWPAILFSVMHVIPFGSAGLALLSTILMGALFLSLIAGYFRADTGSLSPALLAHFLFNLVGYIAMLISPGG